MIFLKAYQAYHNQNYDQCLNLLQDFKDDDLAKTELLAQVHFQKQEYQEAYDIYKALLNKGNPENIKQYEDNIQAIIVCAQLVQPGSLKIKGKDKLPRIDDIIDQVDSIELKDSKVSDLFLKRKSNKGTKKRKRKIRLPKQYDPNVAPDPERWIPKRDRKGNAHKQKKRRQKQPTKRR